MSDVLRGCHEETAGMEFRLKRSILNDRVGARSVVGRSVGLSVVNDDEFW